MCTRGMLVHVVCFTYSSRKAADTKSSALLCKARRTLYGFRNTVAKFRLILYEYDQKPHD